MVALKKEEIDLEAKLEEAKSRLIKEAYWSENASGAFVYANGEICVKPGTVCHAFLSRGPDIVYIVTGLQDGEGYGENPGRILAHEVEVWYLDYILNRSPYADTFITKDAEKALEERLVVSNTEHADSLTGGAIVALRRLWEHVYVARAAYDLVQAGLNEDLAFLLGHCIQAPSNIKPDTTVSWSACLNWHTSIDPNAMGFEAVKKFVDKNFKVTGASYYETGRYRGYSYMYGGNYNQSLHAYVKQQFPYELCKETVTAKSSNNPFLAAKKVGPVGGGKTAPYAKAIEVMAEWAKTHLTEKINAA